MKSSRESNINKLTSKLGLVKKAGFVPGVTSAAMGHTKPPAPLDRKKVERFRLDEKKHGVEIPKYSLYYNEKLGVAYLIDENNNVVTLDDIRNHPLYGPAMLQHIAPELAGTAYKDLDEATKKKLGDYQEDARRSGRQFHVDDIPGVYEDGFDELKNRYYNVYGAPLHSGEADPGHKLKEGAVPYIIGGDVLSKLPVLTITDANGNVTKKPIVTPETVMQALAMLKSIGDAILEDDLNRFFNQHYSPHEVFKHHDSGTLRYVILNYYNPETGKFEEQDLSDEDWTTDWDQIFNEEEAAKRYKPRDYFVPAYQQAAAIAMGLDTNTIDPFYELGNLGHVIAGKDGISRLGGVEDYVDLGTYLDKHLQELQEALRDKLAFQTAMDYVERGNVSDDSFAGNAKAKLIYDFISKNAEALRQQGKTLSDLLSGKIKSLAVYDELGKAIPVDLMRFSSMMNEGDANPVFIDHLGREFSKNPRYVPNFKTHVANQLLGVHDDLDPDNPYDLQRGFFSKNPAYAKYNAENPLVAMQLGRIADSGLQMRRRAQNDSDILTGLLGQKTADFLKALKEKAYGASYDHTAKLLNLGLLLNDQTYRRNNYNDLSYALDNAWTNRTFNSAATKNPLSETLDLIGMVAGMKAGKDIGLVGELFGQNWYDKTIPVGGAIGKMVTDVVDPGLWVLGTAATATGSPYDRFGYADQNEYLKEHITKPLEEGFKGRGYNYSTEDYYDTAYLGNISNLLAGDQTSIFNSPGASRVISTLEVGAPFLPLGGGVVGKAATRGIPISSRLSPMALGSVRLAREANDLARVYNTMDDILLRSADGKQITPLREAAMTLNMTTDELFGLLDNSNIYKALFGQDGVADLRPGNILGRIRDMYNGNFFGSAAVAGVDLATFGGAIPNTLMGTVTNPRRALTIRGMYDAQNLWAKNWYHTFNGTLPKKWWQLDLSPDGRILSPFNTIDDQYRAFGLGHIDNILWDPYTGGHSLVGNVLYNPLSVLRYSYPINQFRMAAASENANQSGSPADVATLLYVSLNDHTPEIMRGELLSLHITNPNTIAALNPRSDSNTLNNGKFPWLALGVGAGAAGLGIYLYNKKKEEEEKRKRLQLKQYLLLGQVYRPHVGRQYMR